MPSLFSVTPEQAAATLPADFTATYPQTETLFHWLRDHCSHAPVAPGEMPSGFVAENVLNNAATLIFGPDHRLLLDCTHADDWVEPASHEYIDTWEEVLVALETARAAIAPDSSLWNEATKLSNKEGQ